MDQKPDATDEAPREVSETEQVAPVVITRPTWVTWAAVGACVAIFVGVNLQEDKRSLEVLSRFGFLPAEVIWSGAWWGTLSSTFVHIDLIHVFFNLYWLWHLGRLMEDELGSLRLLGFYLGASLISSTSQLAVSDTTGIGASGVVYAMFGFMWRSRSVYPKFQSIIVQKTIKVFFIWLVACFFLTAAKLMNIANAAHLSGLVYGVVVAECFVMRQRRAPWIAGAVVLAGASLIPLWWASWSTSWQWVKVDSALAAGRRDEVMERLNTIIKLDPLNVWAYQERGRLYAELGEREKSDADLKKAREIETAAKE